MCHFASFLIKRDPANPVILRWDWLSHSRIHEVYSLVPDDWAECEWVGNDPEHLTIRVLPGEGKLRAELFAWIIHKYPSRADLLRENKGAVHGIMREEVLLETDESGKVLYCVPDGAEYEHRGCRIATANANGNLILHIQGPKGPPLWLDLGPDWAKLGVGFGAWADSQLSEESLPDLICHLSNLLKKRVDK